MTIQNKHKYTWHKWGRFLKILLVLFLSACSDYERSIYDPNSPNYIGDKYVPIEIQTIDKILESGETSDSVKVQATVVATHTRGLLLSDETGYILVNMEEESGDTRHTASDDATRSASSYTIGDVVTVEGVVTSDAGLLQFPSISKIQKLGSAEVVHPEPEVWNSAAFYNYFDNISVRYVKYTGILSKEDDDYIVTVSDSAITAIGQITYPVSDLVNAINEGEEVQVIGYAIGYTDDKYVRTMVTSIKVVEVVEQAFDETAVAEAVDLGLSVKWASWNVGATKPEDYGGYYAWGETEVKSDYRSSTYKWYDGAEYTMTKYCVDDRYGTVDDKTVLDLEDDVAYVKWGGDWRMPTRNEVEELIDGCIWSRTTQQGVMGYKVAAPNGNSIFFPAAGVRELTGIELRGSYGYYWSAGLAKFYNSNNYESDCAYLFYFHDDYWSDWDGGRYRWLGQTVRPVKDPETKTIAEVLALGVGTRTKIKATIVAIHNNGFLLNDGTGYIYIYKYGADSVYAVGDVVTVTGEVHEYGYILAFSGYYADVRKVGTAEVVHPEPVVWDGASLDSYLTSPEIQYVQCIGTLSFSNGYYYITVNDATTAVCRLLQFSKGSSVRVGQRLMLTGYTVGCVEGKYVETIVTTVKSVVNESAVAEAVDLGLSVKWASWNVGATVPEEFGGYYAWGETEVKDYYDWSTYKWGDYNSLTKYCTDSYFGIVDGKTVLDPEDDVAYVKWGADWRMPTRGEIQELCDNCSWQWTMVNGIDGCKVTGPNGNSIFLPAASYVYHSGTLSYLYTLYYWCNMVASYGEGVSYLYSSESKALVSNGGERNYGYSVRPVFEYMEKVSIAELQSSDEGRLAVVEATIVAAHTRGFLLHDDTGYIFVNLGEDRGYTVGDVVKVVGTVTMLNGLLSFMGTAVTKVSTAEVVHPEPVVWDGTALNNYLSSPSIQHVQYTGTVSKIGDYYSVATNGITSAIGRVFQPSEGLFDEGLVGRRVTLTGYMVGCSEGKYVEIMPTYVEIIDMPFDETAIAEAVDLGLSVKWASWNVGATVPEEYGGYYAWGETEVKVNYDWTTYKWCNGDRYNMTKYCSDRDYGTVDYKTMLDPEDDVAHVKWGGAWRMPTLDEIKELTDKCSWNWTSQNGLKGCKVIGPNGNFIFLPAAGFRSGTKVYDRDSYGYYWSSTLYYTFNVDYLYFYNGNWAWGRLNNSRYYGHTVRPVKD